MMDAYLVNCFCTESTHSGNPAGVVLNFDEPHDAKLKLAKVNNLPVTVFITNHTAASPLLEFYYPEREMPLCLHGTLAAAEILLKDGRREIEFTTNSGKQLKVHTNSDSGCLQVEVAAHVIENIDLFTNTISSLLNISSNQLLPEMPLGVKSVGSPKLIIPLKSTQSLSDLDPNYALIKEWSLTHNVNGLYAYTPTEDKDTFYARGFNPKAGHNEDAATGVAAAALSLALKRSITVEQGHYLGLPCSIIVSYNHEQSIWVGGKVKLIRKLP